MLRRLAPGPRATNPSRLNTLLRSLLPALLALLAAPSPAAAQCASGWIAGAGVPGLDHIPYVLHTWDRDGAGPQPPVIVAGAPVPSGARSTCWRRRRQADG